MRSYSTFEGASTSRLCRVSFVITLLAFTLFSIFVPVDTAAQEPVSVVTIGESNDKAQRAELLTLFDVADSDDIVTVTVNETLQAMDGIFDLTGIDSAYSSTMLTCRAAGTGIAVQTRHIDSVPASLYALALVTAGVDDARLIVAAPADAPALGMTALTGVFQTVELTPCASAAVDPARQRLALAEMALLADIGQSLDTSDGVADVTDLVITVQGEIVAGDVMPDQIAELVTDEATAIGIDLKTDDRDALVDLLTRLADAEFAWGTFQYGWDMAITAQTSVVLTARAAPNALAIPGDGSAQAPSAPTGVGSLQAQPTVATSQQVRPSPSSTAPPPTATPVSQGATMNAGRSESGATTVIGTLSARDGESITIDLTNRSETYFIPIAADVTRAGHEATLADLRSGDQVTVTTTTGLNRSVLTVIAEPPISTTSHDDGQRFRLWKLALFPLFGLLISFPIAFFKRHQRGSVSSNGPVPAALATLVVARHRARMAPAFKLLVRKSRRRIISRRQIVWLGQGLRHRVRGRI